MTTHLIISKITMTCYFIFTISVKQYYDMTLGEAYSRTKQWGLALKKFYAIQKHFQDYIYDMSDFHGFCLRKVKIYLHGNSVFSNLPIR